MTEHNYTPETLQKGLECIERNIKDTKEVLMRRKREVLNLTKALENHQESRREFQKPLKKAGEKG